MPSVQPNVGCYPEIMNITKGGVIYQPNDSDALAMEIIRLLESPEEIRSMGINGKKIINEKFTLSKMAQQTVSVYNKALSN